MWIGEEFKVLIYPKNRMLCNDDNEWIAGTCNNMDEPCIHYVKQTKPITEGYIQHAIYIKRFSMKNNSLYSLQIHTYTRTYGKDKRFWGRKREEDREIGEIHRGNFNVLLLKN